MVAMKAACKLFILHVFLVFIVSFQITKPGNVESINTVKKFSWVSRTTKIFLCKNLKHKNFITQNFQIYGIEKGLYIIMSLLHILI